MRVRLARVLWLGAAATVVAAVPAGAAVPGERQRSHGPTWRSGNPPVVSSATIDGRRRLVVAWTAPDGMTYGGSIYFDNDPINATPVTTGKYGTLMYCNNKGTCKGRWRLDANPGTGPFTYATESLDASRFPAGTYYLQVEGYNEDPFPSTRQWEWSNIVTVTVPAVDTTAPETTISDGPSGTTTSTSATFTFSASEPASTFACRLDAEAFAACTSPKEYTGLAVGAHTFEVRATDAAGNSDATPAARRWTIAAPPSASAPPPKQQPGAQPQRPPRRQANTVEPPDDNETPACGKAIDRIELLNRELTKAVDNWNFANGLNDNGRVQEVRRNQLDRRIKTLERQLAAANNEAQRACGAEWGGVWRGAGTVVSSKCKERNPATITLTIHHDVSKRTIDPTLQYKLDLKCPATAFPAALRDGKADIDTGVSRVTGKTVTSVTGGVFTLTKTGAETLRGRVERVIAGIRVTLEFTAKRGS